MRVRLLKTLCLITAVTALFAFGYCWLDDYSSRQAAAPIARSTTAAPTPQPARAATPKPAPEVTPYQLTQQTNARGRALYQQGKYREALPHFQRAANAGSNDGVRWAKACQDRLDEARAASAPPPRTTASAAPSRNADIDRASAIVAARNAVRGQLHCPSTARFSGAWFPDEAVIPMSGTYAGCVKVMGSVTAENLFGAPVKQGYACILKPTGRTWLVLDVSVGRS